MSSVVELEVLLRRQNEVARQQLSAIKEYGLPFYRPHTKQAAFHAAAVFKRRMVRSGNRFGKSKMGVCEDCAWLVHERPWLSKGDPLRILGLPQRPVKGLVITTDWDKVGEIFTDRLTGKLWKELPKGYVKVATKNHQGVIDYIECQDGSVLRFDTVKSFQTNPQGSESSDWDFIHVDEPCPELQWKAQARGLIDRGGSAWFTLTPLSEPWINDFFFPERGQTAFEDRLSGNPYRWSISGSTRDNIYLSKEDIDMFEGTLSEDEKQCRISGIPLYLSGMVYKEFQYDKHVLKKLPKGWESYNCPPVDYTLFYAIDPHPQTPHAVLFVAVDPLGNLYVFDEIFEHCKGGTKELARKIQCVRSRFPTIGREICDPLAYIESPTDERCMADDFLEGGLLVEKATKALSAGILAVTAELSKEKPRIFFAPNLTRTLWEFNHYIWDPKGTNKPKDENDHMMENLYRLILEKPFYIEPEKTGSSNNVEMEEFKSSLKTLSDIDFNENIV